MANYLLPCSCGKQISVSSVDAGTRVACDCGAQLQVPSIRGLRELPSADDPAAAKASPAAATPPVLNLSGVLFVVGLLVIFLGLGLAGWNGYVWSQIDTTNHEEAHLTFIQERLDEQPPAELLNIWKEVSAKGLGEHEKPFHVHMQKLSDNAWFYLQAGVLATVLGLAAAGYALFTGSAVRRRT